MAAKDLKGERPAKRTKLLSDESSSEDGSDDAVWHSAQQSPVMGDSPSGAFKINEEYAKRFEHNKKREERQRLEEKYGNLGNRPTSNAGGDEEPDAGRLDSDSESQSEDDEAILATKELDEEIMETLNAIRAKDPRVYNKEVSFYKEVPEEDLPAQKKEPAAKPVYLQDYHRRNLLNSDVNEQSDEPALMTYVEEQDSFKRQLLDQMHTLSDGDDDAESGADEDSFLKRKPSQKPVEKRPEKGVELDVATADKDPETFLSNFMSARAWLPTPTSKFQPFESDDEAEDQRADAFEEAFNMRFEDPERANEKLISHSREAAAKYSVRREETKGRKRARETQKAQKDTEKVEREEEKARLRKLKIEEAQEKLLRFKEAAGLKNDVVSVEQWSNFLETGWDSKKWDQEMVKRFGDAYYADVEAMGSGDEAGHKSKRKKKAKKPKWSDDIDIEDIVPDFDDEQNATRLFGSDDDVDQSGESLPRTLDNDHDPPAKSSKKKDHAQAQYERKRQARKDRQKIEQLVEQSLATELPESAPKGGFQYRETSPTAFGLSAQEILMADDVQLNQYVGLKKLAPFRDAERKRKDKKRLGKKARLRQWRKETFGDAEGPRVEFQDYLADRRAQDGTASFETPSHEGLRDTGGKKAKKKRSRKRKTPEASHAKAAS